MKEHPMITPGPPEYPDKSFTRRPVHKSGDTAGAQ
jgi:hypothetical protein